MPRLSSLAAVLVCLTVPAVGRAAPLAPERVPAPLKPWVDWVLHGQEEAACPFIFASEDQRRCVWPARLGLALDDKGGRFEQEWLVLRHAWVPLPGDAKRWPLDVTNGGAAAVVVDREGAPHVELQPGRHQLSGRFAWDSLPEQLPVPPETGLLSVTLQGKAVPFPQRDEEGRLWLQKEAEPELRQNRVEVLVHRKLVDEIPLELITRVELEVSGESREELLGRALLPDFTAMAIDSSLPARLEPDGRLRVQVRPGTWVIELRARHHGPLAAITLAEAGGPWAEQESWVFDARPHLRLADVSGVPSVDPQQTRLPEEWKRLPAYRMIPGAKLELLERRRGDAEPAPDQLSLARTLWLDFDGGGFTAHDRVNGELRQAWRLTMRPPLQLGRVAVDGNDQFITKLDDSGAVGVELRRRAVEVAADTRYEGSVGRFSAVGWDHDFDSVSAELRLPPGWRLLHVSGVDDARTTWLKSWTLLDLFVLLLVVVAVFKLWGWPWGLIALVTLVLSYKEGGAPQWTWPAVLVAEALVRLLPSGKLLRLAKVYRLVAALVLIGVSIPFLVQQVRQGLYPSLEFPYRSVQPDLSRSEPPPPPPPSPGAPMNLDEDERSDFGLAMEMKPGAGAPAEANVDFKEKAGKKGKLRKLQIQTEQQQMVPLEEYEGDILDGLGSVGVSSSSVGYRGRGNKGWVQKASKNYFDPNAVVQTGPGLPAWSWKSVQLRWSGPVERSQELSLWLLGPAANTALALLRVLLVALLVLCVCGFPGGFWPRLFTGRHGANRGLWLVPIGLLLLAPGSARAQEMEGADSPSPEILEELRARLLEPPECLPTCASSARAMIEATGDQLRLRVEVEAAAPTAVPLPGHASQWRPERVLINGQPAPGLAQTSDGQLWIYLPPGRHQVGLEGGLPQRETVQLALPLKPHRVEARLEGWSIDGLHEDGLADDVLQLTRKRKQDDKGAALEASTLPPFVRVERSIWLGLSWQVETQVVRLTPTGAAVVIEVPLLAGESVTTAELRVVDGKALVNMGPQASTVSWTSVLEQGDKLDLKAPDKVAWTERWQLEASPIWHLDVAGIPTVHQAESGSRDWRPWPGEEVKVKVTRPQGVAGQTLTVDACQIEVTPGLRATDVALRLAMRSSRGGQHELLLPEGAQLQATTINGEEQPLRQEERKVILPLVPGHQSVELRWRQSEGMTAGTFVFRTPAIDVGVPVTNVENQVRMPQDRWVLLVRPQQLGPAVLFWSLLTVLLIASIAISLIKLTPLRWYHWFLLGVGLTQASIGVVFLVAGWLLLLGWREQHPETSKGYLFNMRQVLLAVWSVAALIGLFASVAQGLLGSPEMQIMGNSSSRALLRWYQDRSTAALPQPWVISVPLLVYRAAMLGWALWLAFALLRWLRWGWACFGTGGLWRSTPKKPFPTAPSTNAGAKPSADGLSYPEEAQATTTDDKPEPDRG